MNLSSRFSQQNNHYSKLIDKFFKINNFRPPKKQNTEKVSDLASYFSTRRLSNAYHTENKSFKLPEIIFKDLTKNEKKIIDTNKKSALASN